MILNQIENEYQQPGTPHDPGATQVQHMQQIEAAFRAAGVVVPFTHNEKGMRSQSWSRDYQDVGGAVDVYGLDSYPGGLSCTNPDTGFNVVRTYHQWFQNYSFTQPEYLPEFEGGWFSNWGSDTFYDEVSSTRPQVGLACIHEKGDTMGVRSADVLLADSWRLVGDSARRSTTRHSQTSTTRTTHVYPL